MSSFCDTSTAYTVVWCLCDGVRSCIVVVSPSPWTRQSYSLWSHPHPRQDNPTASGLTLTLNKTILQPLVPPSTWTRQSYNLWSHPHPEQNNTTTSCLTLNLNKTEVLYQPPPRESYFLLQSSPMAPTSMRWNTCFTPYSWLIWQEPSPDDATISKVLASKQLLWKTVKASVKELFTSPLEDCRRECAGILYFASGRLSFTSPLEDCQRERIGIIHFASPGRPRLHNCRRSDLICKVRRPGSSTGGRWNCLNDFNSAAWASSLARLRLQALTVHNPSSNHCHNWLHHKTPKTVD